MAFIHKPGQGYWTRMMSAIGFGTIVLAGVAWLWGRFTVWFPDDTIYWQSGMAVVIILGFGSVLWYLLNKPNIVEFMIATEAEMKKVNWPSKREIYGSTVVVIGGTLFIAAILTVIDIVFGYGFTQIGILAPTNPAG
ncbi:MAG: preprotein translocase subunit SecE [Planctomycetes bacterium]|jgi:preprotein translocase subunit SecE|nr:preprotein translocase subunit SecE [Planctomycetota bacterium]